MAGFKALLWVHPLELLLGDPSYLRNLAMEVPVVMVFREDP